MSGELVPLIDEPLPAELELPPLPRVVAGDLYGALLADAKKPTTRRAREQDATDLARFLKAPGPREACTALVAWGAPQGNAIAAAYLAEMQGRGLSASTINRRTSTLRRLCKLGRKYHVIAWDLDVDTLRSKSYRDTTGPGRAGWLRILEVATRAAARTPKGKRDLALIRLLHDLALRRAEAAGLDLRDVDLDAGRIEVIRKGKSEREPMTLNKPTTLALSRWIDTRGLDPGPLFIRLDRARPKDRITGIDPDSIHLIVGELGKKAGLAKQVRPHGLRHEAITRVLDLTNGNIRAAQIFGGHADPKTTQRYDDNRTDVGGNMTRLLGEDS
jgi:integrase/recombinase XerC